MTQEALVSFNTEIIQASITRPANATQYAAGDVIAAANDDHLVFEKVFQQSRHSGSINTARLRSSANQGASLDCELWLFYDDIAEVGDNVAFAPTDAELDTLVGIIDFQAASFKVGNSGANAAGNQVCEVRNLGLTIRGGGSTNPLNLYGVLVERGTYTPVSGETFTVDLVVTQD